MNVYSQYRKYLRRDWAKVVLLDRKCGVLVSEARWAGRALPELADERRRLRFSSSIPCDYWRGACGQVATGGSTQDRNRHVPPHLLALRYCSKAPLVPYSSPDRLPMVLGWRSSRLSTPHRSIILVLKIIIRGYIYCTALQTDDGDQPTGPWKDKLPR